MKVGTEFGEILESNDTFGTIVYLVDSDPEVVIEKYQAIALDKKIIAAYGMNGRHYLVVKVDGIRKRKIKKG